MNEHTKDTQDEGREARGREGSADNGQLVPDPIGKSGRNRVYTHASFFTGVGGLDIGFERAGFKTVSHSEIEPYACAVLEERWPHIPNIGNIVELVSRISSDEAAGNGVQLGSGSFGVHDGDGTELHINGQHVSSSGDDWKRANIWSAGFPCQDLSHAGRRAGFSDEDGNRTRSGLAFAFLDLVERYRPEAFILENVTGLLTSNQGRDFKRLTSEVADIGFWWAYRVLDSQWFGVPQRRQRVFLLALDSQRHPDPHSAAKVLAVGTSCGRNHKEERAAWAEAARGIVSGPEASGGHGSLADGALTTRTIPAAFGNHGYSIGAQDANGGYLQVVPTIPSSYAKGFGYHKDELVVGAGERMEWRYTEDGDILPRAITSKWYTGRSGPSGDEHHNLLIREKADSAGVRETSGMAGRTHGVEVLADQKAQEVVAPTLVAATINSGGNDGGFRTEPGEHLVMNKEASVAFVKVSRPIGPDGLGERWDRQDVAPTQNTFDTSEVRATTIVAQSSGLTEEEYFDILMPKGIDSPRYKAIGNGVASPVAEWIGRRIIDYLDSVNGKQSS